MLAIQIITSTDEEATKVIQPHNEILVLTLQIVNHNVHRVLINNESSMDVLFYLAYN